MDNYKLQNDSPRLQWSENSDDSEESYEHHTQKYMCRWKVWRTFALPAGHSWSQMRLGIASASERRRILVSRKNLESYFLRTLIHWDILVCIFDRQAVSDKQNGSHRSKTSLGSGSSHCSGEFVLPLPCFPGWRYSNLRRQMAIKWTVTYIELFATLKSHF